jgi:hypothetical protein
MINHPPVVSGCFISKLTTGSWQEIRLICTVLLPTFLSVTRKARQAKVMAASPSQPEPSGSELEESSWMISLKLAALGSSCGSESAREEPGNATSSNAPTLIANARVLIATCRLTDAPLLPSSAFTGSGLGPYSPDLDCELGANRCLAPRTNTLRRVLPVELTPVRRFPILNFLLAAAVCRSFPYSSFRNQRTRKAD